MNIDELANEPAVFSDDRVYRYSLRRDIGGPNAPVLFIMLNPSTADETQDDPTIRRCIGFATSWGSSTLYIANLFAFRATDPKAMKAYPQSVGPANDVAILMLAQHVVGEMLGTVVTAWGANGTHMARGFNVKERLRRTWPLHHLGLTKHGEPKHPLYLKRDTPLQSWP